MTDTLQLMPESWQRLPAVVAHPDDLEYGAASAVARLTSAGNDVGHVIATDGEAGIDRAEPGARGQARRRLRPRPAGTTDPSAPDDDPVAADRGWS